MEDLRIEVQQFRMANDNQRTAIARFKAKIKGLREMLDDQREVSYRLGTENERVRGIMVRQVDIIEGLRKRVVELSASLPGGTEEDPIELE